MRYRLVALMGIVAAGASCAGAQQTSIDFETFPDGRTVGNETALSDQWVTVGAKFIPLGGDWTAISIQEGYHGVENFGNSPVTVCHAGALCESTGMSFVDPLTGLQSATHRVSVHLGDGDSALETFTITLYAPDGAVVDSVTETTGSSGFLYSFEGPAVARMEIRRECDSASGVVFDDLVFDAPPSRCWADFSGDGVVNTIDVLQFLNAWNAESWEANANADWSVDTQDVIAFLNAWTTGC